MGLRGSFYPQGHVAWFTVCETGLRLERRFKQTVDYTSTLHTVVDYIH